MLFTKMQHPVFGGQNKTRPYDKQYFDSLICKHGIVHENGRKDHYSSGEKYCAKDQVFLRVSKEVRFCPKCRCVLRCTPRHLRLCDKVKRVIKRY